MAAHAKFSPSSLHRRLACVGSLAMESGLPDSSSEHADQGTAAHFLAATCLLSGKDTKDYLGETIYLTQRGEDFVEMRGDKVRASFGVDEDMVRYVQIYVDSIRKYAEGADLYVETALPIDHITGEENAVGTGDAIAFSAESDEIQIHDLKYGFAKVSAAQNPQLMCYALGALRVFDGFADFRKARLVIHQPRVSEIPDEWEIDIEHLKAFGEEVNGHAARAFHLLETKADWIDEPGAILNPSKGGEDDHCRYCKAHAACPARIAMVEAEVGRALDEMGGDVALDTSTDVLSKAMLAIPYIEAWCNAVRSEVERKLLSGEEVADFKLVEGRRGARAWESPSAVEEAMKGMRIKPDDMYDKRLISPAAAEKKVKSGAIKPAQWSKLQGMITQADGKPSVAHVSDKRPALEVKPVVEGFDEIEEGCELI